MVAMNVWPTDAADGSVSSEARWRKMGRLWAPTGAASVAAGQALVPSLAFPNLTIRAGGCWVDGHYCELPGDQVLGVTANGLAVVRFDPAANTAQLLYLDGVTVPAQSPTGTFEMPVAKIVGSALTDMRAVVTPSSITFPNTTARDLYPAKDGEVAIVGRDTYLRVAGAWVLQRQGVIGWARTGSFVPSISTYTDIPGSGVNWSAIAGRFYRVIAVLNAQNTHATLPSTERLAINLGATRLDDQVVVAAQSTYFNITAQAFSNSLPTGAAAAYLQVWTDRAMTVVSTSIVVEDLGIQ